MSPTPSDLSVANFVLAHLWLSFVYYAKVGWPYIVIAFLLGSIPFGLIVGRVFFGTDIRTSGSGNIGAANAARTFGRGAGIAVLVLDAGKGALAVIIAKTTAFSLLTSHATMPFFATPMLPDAYGYGNTPISVSLALGPLAALAAVLGHCYSPWLRFRGGKGVATFLGTLVGLGGFKSTSIFAIAWILVALRTGYASLASVVATIAVAIFVVAINFRPDGSGDGNGAILFVVVTAVVVVVRHRANITRLRAGSEPKLALGASKGPTDSRGKRAPTL